MYGKKNWFGNFLTNVISIVKYGFIQSYIEDHVPIRSKSFISVNPLN